MSKAADAARQWLSEQDESVQASYAAVLKDEKALELMGGNLLREADYTRGKQEVAAERKKVESEAAELKGKRDKLVQWQQQAETKYTKALRENAELQAYKVETEATKQLWAERYGIPVEELKLEMSESGKSAEESAKAVADQGGVAAVGIDKDTFEGGLNSVIGINTQVFDIAQEHRELFGETIKAEELIKKVYASEGKSVREVWESEYGVADKRAELAEAAITERIEKAKAEAVEEYRRENPGSATVPGASPGVFKDQQSPLLADEDIKKRLNRTDENPIPEVSEARSEDTVQSAVSMFEQRMAERAAG